LRTTYFAVKRNNPNQIEEQCTRLLKPHKNKFKKNILSSLPESRRTFSAGRAKIEILYS